MTTRENLIPDDQPYGERQAQRERMRMAGLPTATPRQPPLPGLAALGGGAPAGQAPMEGGVDIFEEIEPTLPFSTTPAPPLDPYDALRAMGETAANPFVRELVRRSLYYANAGNRPSIP